MHLCWAGGDLYHVIHSYYTDRAAVWTSCSLSSLSVCSLIHSTTSSRSHVAGKVNKTDKALLSFCFTVKRKTIYKSKYYVSRGHKCWGEKTKQAEECWQWGCGKS